MTTGIASIADYPLGMSVTLVSSANITWHRSLTTVRVLGLIIESPNKKGTNANLE
jgi:hypothetical protein